jgi:hypothetical protein
MVYAPTSEEAHMEGVRSQSLAGYRALLADRDGELATVHQTIGPGSDRWQRREANLRDAEEKCRAIFARLMRLTDGKRISTWLFVLAAIVLAVLEAPINKFMLDNILVGSNFDSYALSLFVTLCMLYLAHIAGAKIRQVRSAYQEKIYWSHILVSLAILVVLSACVGALTIGRAFYSIAATGPVAADIFAEIGRQIQSIGILASLRAALSDKAAFFLACLNSAGIAVAFLAAFIKYDSDKIYQSALDAKESSDRALSKMEKKYDTKVAKIARKYAPQLSMASSAYGAQNAQVIALKHNRNAPLTEDDRIDLTAFDYLLSQARSELGERSKRLSLTEGIRVEPSIRIAEDTAAVMPLVARERR